MIVESLDVGKDAMQLIVNIVILMYKVMSFPTDFLTKYIMCYYLVIPEIAEVDIKFPPADLNKPYIGVFDAAGYPRPIVNAVFSRDCPHQIYVTNTTTYTIQAALRIPLVTPNCIGEIFSCTVCQLGTCEVIKTSINIIDGELTLPLKHLFLLCSYQRYIFTAHVIVPEFNTLYIGLNYQKINNL